MDIKDSVFNIIYGEVLKLFRREFGDENTQAYTKQILESSQLITDKLEGANLLYNPAIVKAQLDQVTQKAREISAKIKAKTGVSKNGSKEK